MPTTTKSQKKAILQHVLDDVLQDSMDDGTAGPIGQDKQWDNWNRATITQACAQDVSNVLDHNYTPTDPTKIALFQEQKKYMYAAFEPHLRTDKGKALVGAHHTNADVQAIYKELSQYALQSAKASLDSASLLAYITLAKLGDGK
jgi:hypothetical protein